jgi:uncharacterized iron-regulated protein
MKVLSAILLTSIVFAGIHAQEPRYAVFDSDGRPMGLNQVIDAMEGVEVVFLGEFHDDAVAHAIQFEILRAVHQRFGSRRKVALSLEMFERDVQSVLDEYLSGLITENHLLSSARPWNNYKTDYRPLVEYAKENGFPVIAANAPRRYVNMVSRSGRESLNRLSKSARKTLAPLPFAEASPAYAAKFNALMGPNSPERMAGLTNILDSQSLWDATMAYAISRQLKKRDSLVIHLNGGFHSEEGLGTPEHLRRYRKGVRYLVVTMRYEDDFRNFDPTKHSGLGDFVILTDKSVPRSFTR